MKSSEEQNSPPLMGRNCIKLDRHFDFTLVNLFPDFRKIEQEAKDMAREMWRLGLDTLEGCKVRP